MLALRDSFYAVSPFTLNSSRRAKPILIRSLMGLKMRKSWRQRTLSDTFGEEMTSNICERSTHTTTDYLSSPLSRTVSPFEANECCFPPNVSTKDSTAASPPYGFIGEASALPVSLSRRSSTISRRKVFRASIVRCSGTCFPTPCISNSSHFARRVSSTFGNGERRRGRRLSPGGEKL